MSRSTTFRITSLFLLLLVASVNSSVASATSYAERTGIVTIYNKTSIHLSYQLRVKRGGEWSKWENYEHKHPHGGWQYHTFDEVDKIEIRFDRIGGDDEYTEKIYDLEYNTVVPYKEKPCRHKGRKYKFEFDRGGRLLDLYRSGW